MAAEKEEVTTELTTTQYVILAENQRKKKALADVKAQVTRLAEENAHLQKTLETSQRESFEVTEHLRQELLQRNEKIAEMEALLDKAKAEGDENMAKLREEAKQREMALLAECGLREADLKAKLDAADAELRALDEFRQLKASMEGELAQLREENVTLTERIESQRAELERYYLELNSKLRKEYEQRLEELKKSGEEEVSDKLDAAVKRILGQNRRLAEELKIHVQETDALQSEVRILEAERSRLMREVQLKTELEEGYAKRGAKQSNVIKESNLRIVALEESMAQLMAAFDRERKALQHQAMQQVADGNAEVEALRRLVKLKTRELRNIRRLSQEVLLQRSDVESFLLSSLHQVRKQMERESLFRSENPTQPPEGAAAALNGQMDLKSLSWEDRERVLRLLFAKINNQAQQVHFSNLPEHPLDAQLTGLTTTGGLAPIA